MDSLDKLPDKMITAQGNLSRKFLDMGIDRFIDACNYVRDMEYGYNSDYEDKLILFKEMKGSCTSKHAVIAGLASELGIPLYKKICVYKFTEEITTGASKIIEKYQIPYVPMIHCFLVYNDHRFDLTEGNDNGKKKPIDNCIHAEKVEAFISRKDEYLRYKDILKEHVLPRKEMKGISERRLLKAREESIILLKECIKK